MDKLDLIYDVVRRLEKKIDQHISNEKLHDSPLTVKELALGIAKFSGMVGVILAIIKYTKGIG